MVYKVGMLLALSRVNFEKLFIRAIMENIMTNSTANSANQTNTENKNVNKETIKSQEKFQEAYHLAEEATSDVVGAIKQQAQERANLGADEVKVNAKKVETMIKERPLMAIGCAFVAGLAVSKLIK